MPDFDPWADCLYARLGVDHDADRDTILKQGSRAKARYKPGRSDLDGERAEEAWYNIQDAYETLTDPDARETYTPPARCGCTSGSDTGPDAGSLTVSADERRVSVGEPVRFTVEREDGGVVPGATLVASSGARTTVGPGGSGTLRFSSPGRVTVEASHDDYESDSVRITVEAETVRLDVSARPARATVGEPVEFTVRDDDGDPVSNVRLEASTGERTRTDADGTATMYFDRPGEVTVRAHRSDDETTYVTDDVEVTVGKERVSLVLDAPSRSLDRGETVTFAVSDTEGEPVAGAVVSGGGRSETTDRGGECELAFDTTGTVTVTAHKEDTATTTYEDAEVDVEVSPGRTHLSVVADRHEVPVGESVEFTVRDGDGRRVEGATVSGGSASGTTGPLGICELSFDEPGTLTVEATKESDSTTYVPETVDVEVTASEVTLDLEAVDGTECTAGSSMRFRVRGEDGPVPGAVVESEGRRATTGERGTCELLFPEAGEFTVRASKDAGSRYVPDEVTVEVQPEPDEHDLRLAVEGDARKEQGETFQFVVTDSESGDPVSDATVEVQENELTRSATTVDGTCGFSIDHTRGQFTVQATVEDDGTVKRSNRERILVEAPAGPTGPHGRATTSGRGGGGVLGTAAADVGRMVRATLTTSRGSGLLEQLSVLVLIVSFIAVIEWGLVGFLAVGFALVLTVLAILNNSP